MQLAGTLSLTMHLAGAHGQRVCKLLTLAAVHSQAPASLSDACSRGWQQPMHGAAPLPDGSHPNREHEGESSSNYHRETSTDSLQGRQRRRRGLQGLTGTGSARPDAIPAPNSSNRRPAWPKPSQTAGLADRSPLLPPHLTAVESAALQDNSMALSQCTAELRDGEAAASACDATVSGEHPAWQESQPKNDVEGVESIEDLDRQLSNGQASSSNAAELTENGDRAEGVLQFGSSGARIPLYGRNIESILQVSSILYPAQPSANYLPSHADICAKFCDQGMLAYKPRCSVLAVFMFLVYLSTAGAVALNWHPQNFASIGIRPLHLSCHAQAVTMDRQRLAGGAYSGVAPDEADDDALDVTFDQLPPRWHSRSNDFDWSGRTNYTAAHRKVQLGL